MAKDVMNINDDNFEREVLKCSTPVFVDFWAPWCGPCVALTPVIEELAGEYAGRIKVVKMNVDENASVPAQFGVRSIPYLVMFKGGEVVDSTIGAQPKKKLKEMFDRSL